MTQRIVLTGVVLATLISTAKSQTLPGSEPTIRTAIRTFADARNSHDGATVANLYSEDGEWIAADGRNVRGRPALADLWGSVEGQVQRAVESIDFAGPNIALVRAITQYREPRGRHHETFI